MITGAGIPITMVPARLRQAETGMVFDFLMKVIMPVLKGCNLRYAGYSSIGGISLYDANQQLTCANCNRTISEHYSKIPHHRLLPTIPSVQVNLLPLPCHLRPILLSPIMYFHLWIINMMLSVYWEEH